MTMCPASPARFVRLVAAFALLLSTLLVATAGPAGAQETGLIDDDTYRFGIGGTEVIFEGDWEFDPENSEQDEGVEFASFVTPSAGLFIGEIASPNAVDLNALLDIVLETLAQDADEFVTVERSATDVVSYSLDAAVLDGVATALFTYVQFNAAAGIITFTSIISDYDSFADNIADAQENVTVGGRIALEGIDGAALQNLLPPLEGGARTSGEGRPGDDDDEQQDEGQDEDGQEEADDAPQPDDEEEQGNDESQSGQDEENDQPVDDELAELGVVENGLYESPLFGVQIEWSGDWELNPDLLTSDEDEEVDGVGLALDADPDALILVSIFDAGDATPADFAAFWESDEYLEENQSEEAEVLLSDSNQSEGGVLIADETEDGDPIWTLRQATALDGGDTIAVFTMVALAEGFPDRLDDAQTDIEVEGDPVLSLFSVDDVADAA